MQRTRGTSSSSSVLTRYTSVNISPSCEQERIRWDSQSLCQHTAEALLLVTLCPSQPNWRRDGTARTSAPSYTNLTPAASTLVQCALHLPPSRAASIFITAYRRTVDGAQVKGQPKPSGNSHATPGARLSQPSRRLRRGPRTSRQSFLMILASRRPYSRNYSGSGTGKTSKFFF